MKNEDLRNEVISLCRLICSQELSPLEKASIRYGLVKTMKKKRGNNDFSEVVVETVLRRLRTMGSGHCSSSLYNLMAVLLGNGGHPEVCFSPKARNKIANMRRWRRWEDLPQDHPCRILL